MFVTGQLLHCKDCDDGGQASDSIVAKVKSAPNTRCRLDPADLPLSGPVCQPLPALEKGPGSLAPWHPSRVPVTMELQVATNRHGLSVDSKELVSRTKLHNEQRQPAIAALLSVWALRLPGRRCWPLR